MFALLDSGSRSLSVVLGLAILALAGGAVATSLPPGEIAVRALALFGITFLALLGSLVLLAAFAWARMSHWRQARRLREYWRDVGLHAASGMATLALTFTLLGIALGVGTLAEQDLTPETIQGVIRELTQHFSLALYSTVVGLPLSAASRATLLLCEGRLALAEDPSSHQTNGDVPCDS